MKNKLTTVFAGLIFIGVGIGVTIWGWSVLSNARASESWPQTQGKVIASEVSRHRKRSGTGSTKRTKTTYKANVTYDYSVNSKKYSSGNISFGEHSSSSSSHARSIVNKYPEGKSVPVYYNPDNPAKAVLEPGVTWGSYVPFIIGIVFGVAGVAACIGSLIGRG